MSFMTPDLWFALVAAVICSLVFAIALAMAVEYPDPVAVDEPRPVRAARHRRHDGVLIELSWAARGLLALTVEALCSGAKTVRAAVPL